MLALPLLVVLGLALVYAQVAGNPHVAGALRGMGWCASASGNVVALPVRKRS